MIMDFLKNRAQQFTGILTNIARDEDGIIRTAVHFDEMRMLKDSDLPDSTWRPSETSPSGYYCYEDAGMTTGAFLSSQALRYKVTGEPEARCNADSAFAGIRFIYNLGKEKMEGYFPKPYGKKVSNQISRDQYIFVLNGLANYHAIADDKTKKEIETMMAKMAEYWMSINYTDSYFGLPASSHLRDFMGSLFLGLIRIPYTYTGAKKFLNEYNRLFLEEKLGARMPETLRAEFLRGGETYDGAMYFRQQENPVMMKTMAIDHLWDNDQEHRELWEKSLAAFWDDDLLIAFDRNDGMNYFIVGFDPEKNRTFLTEPGEIKELENPLNFPELNWGGLRKRAGSTQTAYSAVVIADRLKLRESSELAGFILEKMDISKFRGVIVSGKQHLVPGSEWETKILHSSYLAYWLWAYWLGFERKLWR